MFKINKFECNWLIHQVNNESIQEHLSGMKGTVYDLGCGTRPYEKDILGYAARYVGVDWSNTLHGLKADVVADLNGPLPIEDEVADTVVAFQVLEHLCEPQMFLNEAFRILRPRGGVYLSVPFQWLIHEAPWDFFRYTRFGLEHLLRKAGFVEIVIQAQTGFWTMWFLKLNYQTSGLVMKMPVPLRWLVRAVFVPFWWFDQHLALLLDRFWPGERETAGYFVSARKP